LAQYFDSIATISLKRRERALLLFACVTAVRLYLAINHNAYVSTDAKFDELLFLNHSIEILKGNWLGTYTYTTLVKLPVYSLWLALIQLIGMNLIVAQHILLIISIIILIFSIYPVCRDYKLLLAVYILCLFDPAYLSSQILDRVLRCGAYVSLTIMVFSSYTGMLCYKKHRYAPVFWSILGGVSLSLLWLCREESVWVLPFICLSSITIILTRFNEYKFKGLAITILPIIILMIGIQSLKSVNNRYYERPITAEFKDSNFIRFYGALKSVVIPHKGKISEVPREARMKIYKTSPTFEKIRPHLEGDVLDYWYGIFDNVCKEYKRDQEFRKRFNRVYRSTINPFFQNFGNGDGLICKKRDYYGGWFVWGLLNAIDESGFFNNGAETEKFYNDVFQEIDLASHSGKLKCAGISKSLIPNIELSDLTSLLYNMCVAVKKVVTFWDITMAPLQSSGAPKNRKLFSIALRVRVERSPSVDTKIAQVVATLFKKGTPIFFALSLIVLAYCLLNRNFSLELFIAVSSLVLFLSKIAVVVIFEYYFAPGFYVRYLSPCYFSVIMFIIFSLLSIRRINFKMFKLFRHQERENFDYGER
jgi:hypothetical protein